MTSLANVLVIAPADAPGGAPRRILRALIVLTVVIVVLTGLGFGAIVDNARAVRAPSELEILAATSQLLILVAFMFSFVLAMTAAFLGSPAISADLESGVLLAIAARPIRRAEILVGKWLGLGVIVGGYAVVAGLLEIYVVNLTSGYMPPEPLVATLYLAAQALVLLSVSVLLSTRLPPIAGGAVAVVLFGLSWIAGILVNVAGFLGLDVAGQVTGGRPLPAPARWPLAGDRVRPRAAGDPAAGPEPAAIRAPPGSSRTARSTPRAVRRRASCFTWRCGPSWSCRWPSSRSGAARSEVPRAGRPPPRSAPAAVPEAGRQVVVHEADALHERVDDRRADEPEAARLQVARERLRGWRCGRDVARLGRARQPRHGTRHRASRYASNDPKPAWIVRTAWALPIVASILAAFRTMPVSAMSRALSAAPNAATRVGSKPRKAARNASRLLRIVDHDRPAWTTPGRAVRTAPGRRGPPCPIRCRGTRPSAGRAAGCPRPPTSSEGGDRSVRAARRPRPGRPGVRSGVAGSSRPECTC